MLARLRRSISNELFSFKQFIANLCVMSIFSNHIVSARSRLSERLRAPGDLRRISAEAGLTHTWVSKFLYGQIGNPTVKTLGQLIEYLDRTEERKKPGGKSISPPPSG